MKAKKRTPTVLEQITPEYVRASAAAVTREAVSAVVSRLDEALRAFDEPPLDRYAGEARAMAGLLRDTSAGDYDATLWSISVSAFTLQYVLKPVDIIPDELPVIGHLDDAIVVAHGIDLVRERLEAYERWERSRR